MKTIDCPLIGRRAYTEFSAYDARGAEPADLGECSPGKWVFARNSVPTERTEWWFHGATQLWFCVRRDTATDEIIEVRAARG